MYITTCRRYQNNIFSCTYKTGRYPSNPRKWMVHLPGILEWFYLVTSGSSLSEHQNYFDFSFCQSPQDSHLVMQRWRSITKITHTYNHIITLLYSIEQSIKRKLLCLQMKVINIKEVHTQSKEDGTHPKTLELYLAQVNLSNTYLGGQIT